MSLPIFISLLICSICFGNYYIHHQELETILLNYHIWSYCSWFDVCWSFGVVGFEWYPCCRQKHIYYFLLKFQLMYPYCFIHENLMVFSEIIYIYIYFLVFKQ